jgi:hypothetical protein
LHLIKQVQSSQLIAKNGQYWVATDLTTVGVPDYANRPGSPHRTHDLDSVFQTPQKNPDSAVG